MAASSTDETVKEIMIFALINLVYTVGLLLGMLFLLEVGRRIGLRRMAVDKEGARTGIGTVEGALLALLGLLIAFSFSGAAARYDARRQQIIDEANDIGSAYMLVDLLPPEAQPPLRDKFRQYVDSRLEAYRRMPDIAAAKVELERSKTLQNDIWTQAVTATRDTGYQPVALQILPAISKMVNISTQRTVAIQMHPPTIIFVMLAGLMLIGSLLAGYGMASRKSRSWVHTIAFAVILALTFYVIRDLEFPRLPGLVGLNNFDNVLVDLRKSMH
ncbi:MAG TPA: hypothetical protein VJS44_12250 [Pyrinomonadaceae bacterium]|nr:hypothetical protein [Pyrinomonadaceae bacterium]